MPADNRAQLLTATRRRADETRARARAALQRLDRDGVQVNFVNVAKAAAVSRALLYRDPDLRAEIERLRTTDRPHRGRLPAAQRASDASLRQRLEALQDEVRTLRTENQQLRQCVAGFLGEQRAAAVQVPKPRPPIGASN